MNEAVDVFVAAGWFPVENFHSIGQPLNGVGNVDACVRNALAAGRFGGDLRRLRNNWLDIRFCGLHADLRRFRRFVVAFDLEMFADELIGLRKYGCVDPRGWIQKFFVIIDGPVFSEPSGQITAVIVGAVVCCAPQDGLGFEEGERADGVLGGLFVFSAFEKGGVLGDHLFGLRLGRAFAGRYCLLFDFLPGWFRDGWAREQIEN